MSYQSEVMADSPLAYWKLDTTSPADAAGLGGWLFAANVTVGGAPLLADSGRSVHGDGANPIATRDAVPASLSGDNVTLEAWVNLPGTNVKGSFVKVGSSANGWGVGVGGTQWDNVGQKLILLSEAKAWHPTTYTFPGAGTYHVMVVRGTGGAVTAYVNGTAVWSGTLTAPIAAAGQMGVGGYTETYGFKLSASVQVDDVSAYAAALSAARAGAHYNAGSGSASAVAADTPVTWLKLDETTASTPVADASGNGRVISLVGSPSLSQASLLGDGSGTSVGFDGATQYGTIVSAAWMDLTAGLTVEARVRPNAGVLTAGGFIASRWSSSAPGNSWLFGVTNTGKLKAQIVTGGTTFTATGATTLAAGTAYTVALRWTLNGTLDVLLNGVVDGSVAAPGAVTNSTAPIELSRAALASGSGLTWNGLIDEVSVTAAALSDARLAARHAAAVATVSTTAGTVAATLPSLTGSAVGTVTPMTTGTVAGTLPSLTGAIAGTPITAGASDGALPSLTGSASGTVAGMTTGIADGTLPALSGTVRGDVTGPTTGAVAGTLPALAGQINAAGAEDLLAAHSVTQATSSAGAPFTGDLMSAHSVTETSSALGSPVEVEYLRAHSVTETSSAAVPLLVLKLDPQTNLPQFRLLVVDRTGQQQHELRGAALGDGTYRLGGDHDFSFTIPKTHPRAGLLGIGAEVQVWSGDEMLPESWFLIVADPIDGGSTYTYKCKGLRAHFDNVVIGKARPELLKNGGFEDGIRYWHATWASGSAAEAPPDVSIVSGDEAIAGGKALRTTAVEKVVVKTVQTAAIFYGNQPYAGAALSSGYLSGGEQIIRDQVKDFGKGASITVEGFTADVDAGTGLALSQRRADAAKATILAYRPDLKVTAIGRGESVQVASNRTAEGQAKNRRIVITGSATRIGHRQFVQQFLRYTNTSPVATKLELSGWLNLISYVGPSKDGWGLYINRRKASDPKQTILDEQHTAIEATFPKKRWTPDGTSIEAPNDGAEHIYEVRLYGTAGDTKFDEVSLKPNLLTAWYNVTKPTLFAGLVAHAQDPAYGKVDLNIEANCPAYGPRDDFEYEWKTHRKVNDALAEQLRADDAPDFAIVTTSTRRIATTWARRGRRNPVHFELGGIVEGYTGGGDIDQLATTGIVTSNLDGGGLTEAYVRGDLVNGLVIERAAATEPNRTQARAAQIATRMVRLGRHGVIDSVTCKPSKTTMLLGKVWLGDTTRCTVRDGKVNVDGWARVTEVKLSFARRQLTYALEEE